MSNVINALVSREVSPPAAVDLEHKQYKVRESKRHRLKPDDTLPEARITQGSKRAYRNAVPAVNQGIYFDAQCEGYECQDQREAVNRSASVVLTLQKYTGIVYGKACVCKGPLVRSAVWGNENIEQRVSSTSNVYE